MAPSSPAHHPAVSAAAAAASAANAPASPRAGRRANSRAGPPTPGREMMSNRYDSAMDLFLEVTFR